VFENRVLRRIFGPKRDEVTGGWRILHNEAMCEYTVFSLSAMWAIARLSVYKLVFFEVLPFDI
jgi:hypothetical protein